MLLFQDFPGSVLIFHVFQNPCEPCKAPYKTVISKLLKYSYILVLPNVQTMVVVLP